MAWTAVPARDRHRPAGFIKPCNPVLSTKVPTGPDWIHELKWDGYRIMARRDGDRVNLWSRTGMNWASTLPRIAAALRALPVSSVTLDGEAVTLRADGYSDFLALRTKRGSAGALLMAFDVLEIDGEDLRRVPLVGRRARLQALLAEAGDGLVVSVSFPGEEGEALFERACAMNFEGIVSKVAASPYVGGRYNGWRKIKCAGYVRSP